MDGARDFARHKDTVIAFGKACGLAGIFAAEAFKPVGIAVFVEPGEVDISYSFPFYFGIV